MDSSAQHLSRAHLQPYLERHSKAKVVKARKCRVTSPTALWELQPPWWAEHLCSLLPLFATSHVETGLQETAPAGQHPLYDLDWQTHDPQWQIRPRFLEEPGLPDHQHCCCCSDSLPRLQERVVNEASPPLCREENEVSPHHGLALSLPARVTQRRGARRVHEAALSRPRR